MKQDYFYKIYIIQTTNLNSLGLFPHIISKIRNMEHRGR
jgi:hypothetical protein